MDDIENIMNDGNREQERQKAQQLHQAASRASEKAFAENSSQAHFEASKKHQEAAAAMRLASEFTQPGATIEERGKQRGKFIMASERHAQLGKVHEAEGEAIQQAETAQGEKPQDAIYTATAKAMEASPDAFPTATVAMNQYLHTQEGNSAYRQYRARILAGAPGLPRSAGGRTAH